MFKLLLKLYSDEYAGATIEWLLVSGASVIMFSALAHIINVIIMYIFTRSEVIISTPFG